MTFTDADIKPSGFQYQDNQTHDSCHALTTLFQAFSRQSAIYVMSLDRLGNTLHSDFQDTARYGKIQAHKTIRIPEEKAVPAFHQNSRHICEETRHIVHIQQTHWRYLPSQVRLLPECGTLPVAADFSGSSKEKEGWTNACLFAILRQRYARSFSSSPYPARIHSGRDFHFQPIRKMFLHPRISTGSNLRLSSFTIQSLSTS